MIIGMLLGFIFVSFILFFSNLNDTLYCTYIRIIAIFGFFPCIGALIGYVLETI
jgi:hypothetical protein